MFDDNYLVNDGSSEAEERLAKVLLQLEEVAERLGVKIVSDDLAIGEQNAKSGACFFRGATYIILDRKLNTGERIRVLIRELAKFDLDGIYIPPQIRELIRPE